MSFTKKSIKIFLSQCVHSELENSCKNLGLSFIGSYVIIGIILGTSEQIQQDKNSQGNFYTSILSLKSG